MKSKQMFYGSICLSDISELAQKKDPSITTAKNGKKYMSINVWVKDEADQYGNNASIQTSFKDATNEQKHYVGNLKEAKMNNTVTASSPLPDISHTQSDQDDLPF